MKGILDRGGSKGSSLEKRADFPEKWPAGSMVHGCSGKMEMRPVESAGSTWLASISVSSLQPVGEAQGTVAGLVVMLSPISPGFGVWHLWPPRVAPAQIALSTGLGVIRIIF